MFIFQPSCAFDEDPDSGENIHFALVKVLDAKEAAMVGIQKKQRKREAETKTGLTLI